MKYKVKYWINVDYLAEEIIEADDLDEKSITKGKYSEPSKDAKYTLLDKIKIERRTFEEYDEKSNISSKDGTGDQWY